MECSLKRMKRVLILGPGASGKSTLGKRLGEITGIPVIELDKLFWQSGLVPTPPEQWAEILRKLVAEESWILDGDLGPYDVIEIRLRAADTIVFLDLPLLLCAWRAVRRSREHSDFWRWLFAYRTRYRTPLLLAIQKDAPGVQFHRLCSPRQVELFIEDVAARPSRL